MIGADGDKSGLKTAIAELHDPAAPVPGADDAEQLDMLPSSPLSAQIEARGIADRQRKAGRPAGSKNKNTEAWRKHLLGRYTSPLEVLAQTYTLPVEELCGILSCTKLEAFKIQIQAAKELAPYVHQKMPQAVDVSGGGLVQLVINTGGGEGGAAVASMAQDALRIIDMEESESEQNQMFTAAEIENSNDPASNETSEDVENNE